MPYKTTKRGKKRIVGSVMVRGSRREKVFPDGSRKSFGAAVKWEDKKRQELEDNLGSELTIQGWIDDYLNFAKVKFKGHSTYTAKKTALNRLAQTIGSGKPVKKLTLAECLKHLRKQAKLRTGNAANRDRKELGTAWEYGRKYYSFPDMNPFRKVDKFPETKKARYVPPLDNFLKVLACTEGQDWVMLMVFLCLAPRRSEVFNMKRVDIDFENKRIRFWTRKRKGGNLESDWLPAIDILVEALRDWLPKRKAMKTKNRSHVFVSPRTGESFKARSGFLKGLCVKTGVHRFGFHAIRHLTALFLYYNGETTQTIQMILRHKDPRTTSKYLKRIGVEEGRKGLSKISDKLKQVISDA